MMGMGGYYLVEVLDTENSMQVQQRPLETPGRQPPAQPLKYSLADHSGSTLEESQRLNLMGQRT